MAYQVTYALPRPSQEGGWVAVRERPSLGCMISVAPCPFERTSVAVLARRLGATRFLRARKHVCVMSFSNWIKERGIGEIECLIPDMNGVIRGQGLSRPEVSAERAGRLAPDPVQHLSDHGHG